MRYRRFAIAFTVVAFSLVGLIYSAVIDTAKAVVTVEELTYQASSQSNIRNNIRLGARVADDPIEYRTTPDFLLRFMVKDIAHPDSPKIKVVYKGTMPDTLKEGRDIILEGDFNGNEFEAKYLLTQCPSKYKPPIPGEEYS